jgi:hypothetical protein
MRDDDLDREELLELDPEGGVIRFAGQRALLLDAVATLYRKLKRYGLIAGKRGPKQRRTKKCLTGSRRSRSLAKEAR